MAKGLKKGGATRDRTQCLTTYANYLPLSNDSHHAIAQCLEESDVTEQFASLLGRMKVIETATRSLHSN